MSRAVLDNDKYTIGRYSGHSRCGISDLGYQSAGLVVRMPSSHPPVDQQGLGLATVRVDVVGGESVKHHIHVGSRHMIDSRVNTGDSPARAALMSALNVARSVVHV